MNEKELFELEAMIQREAGLNPELKRLWNELEEMRVTPDSDIPEQEFLFEINGKPCFPLGELLNKAFEVFEVVNRDEVFSVEQVYSRMDRIKDKFIFALDKEGMPVAQDAIRSNYMSETTPQQETPRTARPQFNETYVKEVKKGGFVEFDDVKLFGDALRTGPRLNNTQLRKRVEQLSGIATTQLYYAVFYRARDRGIITGTLEGDGIMRYGLTAVAGASPYGAV